MIVWLLKLNLGKNLTEHIDWKVFYILEMFASGKEAIDSILIFQKEANYEKGLVVPTICQADSNGPIRFETVI